MSRIESAYRLGHVALNDVERAYGGAILYFFPFVEQSIERLFYGIMVG